MLVRDTLKTILANQALLEVVDVKDTSSLEDLGIDSMGLVEVIFAIEEAFDIQIPFNANDPADSDFDVSSVNQIARAVEDLITAQSKT